MSRNWAMKSYTVQPLPNGCCLTVVTDTPCHLWARFTNNEPWIHPKARVFRGIPLEGDAYWCFDAYGDLEQIQPGDTLIHTFPVKPRDLFMPAWCYLVGNISGYASPSNSPIINLAVGAPVPFSNLGFEDWTNPLLPPPFWTFSQSGSGFTRLYREAVDIKEGKYAAHFHVTGYASGGALTQLQSAVSFRNQRISFSGWFKGYAYSNNGFMFVCYGPGGWTLWGEPSISGVWQYLTLTGDVPPGATLLALVTRAYSGSQYEVDGRADGLSLWLP